MSADNAEERDRSSDSAAELDALVDEVQLLHDIRGGLEAEAADQVLVEAVTAVIQERQADLERAETPT